MWRQPPSRGLFRLISRPSPVKFPSCTGLATICYGPSNAAFLNTKQNSHRTMQTKQLNAVKSDDLFRYTSGRWLIDEKAQQQLRFVKFDLDGLCRLAASYFGDATKCVRVVKLEGNFNKALLLAMDDGNEVIAKIPCSNAGPPSLTTASEVATLKFRMYSIVRFRS
ncbi:uncharacterized protein N7518_000063 [Penicillium psychrosexuale]|uniref:uncharacterized protein n=1 Tax=Penicillium psychrosexuale TaxID=1002107 RepID=UPI0025459B34|nr:uncharacterized protein N7518_000063 [Penicillium psychrosexuale]KAJ5803760.1 hypothetical protein N7518_000063 [Penicillium psychrosexuale]